MSRLCPVFSARRLFFSLPFWSKITCVQNGQKSQLVFFENKSPFEHKSAPKSLFFTFALCGQKLSLVFFMNRSSLEHKYLPRRRACHSENSSQPERLAYCSLCVSAAFIISRTSACLLGGTSSQSSSISRIAVISFSSSSSRRR